MNKVAPPDGIGSNSAPGDKEKSKDAVEAEATSPTTVHSAPVRNPTPNHGKVQESTQSHHRPHR